MYIYVDTFMLFESIAMYIEKSLLCCGMWPLQVFPKQHLILFFRKNLLKFNHNRDGNVNNINNNINNNNNRNGKKRFNNLNDAVKSAKKLNNMSEFDSGLPPMKRRRKAPQ